MRSGGRALAWAKAVWVLMTPAPKTRAIRAARHGAAGTNLCFMAVRDWDCFGESGERKFMTGEGLEPVFSGTQIRDG